MPRHIPTQTTWVCKGVALGLASLPLCVVAETLQRVPWEDSQDIVGSMVLFLKTCGGPHQIDRQKLSLSVKRQKLGPTVKRQKLIWPVKQ